jgi:hypothetical protein
MFNAIHTISVPSHQCSILHIYISHSFTIHFFCSATAPTGAGPPHYQGLRSHSDTPHPVRLLGTSDQPDAETSTSQTRTHKTDTHDPHGILLHNPIKRVATGPCVKMHGHCVRPSTINNLY